MTSVYTALDTLHFSLRCLRSRSTSRCRSSVPSTGAAGTARTASRRLPLPAVSGPQPVRRHPRIGAGACGVAVRLREIVDADPVDDRAGFLPATCQPLLRSGRAEPVQCPLWRFRPRGPERHAADGPHWQPSGATAVLVCAGRRRRGHLGRVRGGIRDIANLVRMRRGSTEESPLRRQEVGRSISVLASISIGLGVYFFGKDVPAERADQCASAHGNPSRTIENRENPPPENGEGFPWALLGLNQ